MYTKDELEAQKIELEIANLERQNRQLDLEILEQDRARQVIESSSIYRGEFLFLGQVDELRCHSIAEKMDQWSQNHPGQPITMMINSQGGHVTDGLAFYDIIRDVLAPRGPHIRTVGTGMVASMGGILLQAGDERLVTRHCRMLIHEVQALVAGSFSKLEDDMKFNETLQNDCLRILASRSTLSADDIRNRWKHKDWWLNAQETVDLGFADRIV